MQDSFAPRLAGPAASLPPSRLHPWLSAWLLIVPFALWLVLDKGGKLGVTAMDPSMMGMPRDLGPVDWVKWMLHYAWLRFVIALLVAIGVQRLFLRRRPVLAPLVIVVVLWALMVGLVAWKTPDRGFGQVFADWTGNLLAELRIFAICIWRELATAALLALVVGALFRILPASTHGVLRWIVMVLVVVLCVLAGLDFSYESATGQPPNGTVLMVSASSLEDFAPLMKAEATPVRLLMVFGGVLLSIAWFSWLGRSRRSRPSRVSSLDGPMSVRGERRALAAAVIGSLALLAPTLSTGVVPLERHSEGTFVAFVKTASSPEAREALRHVRHDFDTSGEPPWHSADMRLVRTDHTRPLNVVVVMLESVRAASTTVHDPSLQTTPFLASMAKDGLKIEDMTVVYPRTNGAWVAILSGQYPLTIEGVTRWTAASAKEPLIRSMPSLLRTQGYATAFFTPTDLAFIDEIAVVRALGFEHVASEPELKRPGEERSNYLGLADQSMVAPILQWTAEQQKAGKPFFTAIMTNVGHHPYTTPASWKKVEFPGVTDDRLNDYYNCLLYIDGFIHDLMAGYKSMGLLDDTVFVVLGDHGQFFGEHGIRQAFNGLYDEGIHTPALIYAPGLPQLKGVVSGPRQQVDVMPTVFELLGLQAQGGRLPGRSLLSPPDPDRKLFYSASMGNSALAAQEGSRKYIYYFDRAPMEAFDIGADPKEARPVQMSEEEASRVKRDMLEWRAASELSMYARQDPDSTPQAPHWSQK